MARNPLQDQLLKAGLVNKNKLDQVVRQQQKARTGKAAPAAEEAERVDAERLRAEHAERDRQLEAQRRAEREREERASQVRQIIEAHAVRGGDEGDYRFQDGAHIRSLRIAEAQRRPLARGLLAIARLGQGYALVPRDTAARLRSLDASVLVLDNSVAEPAAAPPPDSDEAFYARFEVPDDLVW